MKTDKMGGLCGMHGEKTKRTGVWWENLKKGDCFEDQGVDWRIL